MAQEQREDHLPSHHLLLFLGLCLLPILLLHHLIPPSLLGSATPRVKKFPTLPLRFSPDGTFKILQVADLHYGMGILSRCQNVLPEEFDRCSDLNSTSFLRRMIWAERPDLVVFTGDNIFGPSTSDSAESLFKAFGVAMESKLPWAAILGNHDQESTMNREELMSFMSLMDYSVSQVNPSDVRHVDINGFGNYYIKIHGPYCSEMANQSMLNLYFLDSGDRELVNGRRTYGWIKESQLLWLRETSIKLQDAHTAPAMTFFHIPIPEIRQLWSKQFIGQFQEGVACSSVNSGVLRTLVNMGDVKAVFIGHDHSNDFCGNIDGIWFCYGGGFGYHGYGRNGWPRRARVILSELRKGQNSWSGVGRIRTWKRLDDQLLTMIDDQILWEDKPGHQGDY